MECRCYRISDANNINEYIVSSSSVRILKKLLLAREIMSDKIRKFNHAYNQQLIINDTRANIKQVSEYNACDSVLPNHYKSYCKQSNYV